METHTRTIGYAQYIRLYFEPTKDDGVTPGAVDQADHPVQWAVDGVPLVSGGNEIGVARFFPGGSTCDVHALSEAGGQQTFAISATGDADRDAGQVRDLVWTFELALTTLPDEAVNPAGRVSEPLSL